MNKIFNPNDGQIMEELRNKMLKQKKMMKYSHLFCLHFRPAPYHWANMGTLLLTIQMKHVYIACIYLNSLLSAEICDHDFPYRGQMFYNCATHKLVLILKIKYIFKASIHFIDLLVVYPQLEIAGSNPADMMFFLVSHLTYKWEHIHSFSYSRNVL